MPPTATLSHEGETFFIRKPILVLLKRKLVSVDLKKSGSAKSGRTLIPEK